MRDHTDRAGIRCVITAIALFMFVLFVWGPVNTLWVAPWVYSGTEFGSFAWRKAWVINGWILIAPFLLAFSYCILTMTRAIRKDEVEREERRKEKH